MPSPRRRKLTSRSVIRTTLAAVFGLAGISAAKAQSASAAATSEVRTGLPAAAEAADENSGLAEKLQNPIANLISVPFQNNTSFKVGPNKGTQDILNIQPVIPIHVNENWNLITRTILPLVWSPSFQPVEGVPPVGLGPTTFSAFLSPTEQVNGWTFGGGVIVQLPTITNKNLGSSVWGAGPAVVAVRMAHPWVYGLLVNTVFSFGGTSGPMGTRYSLTTINPFLNYNFNGGWFVGASLISTASWDTGGEKWTLPVGAQGGRLIKIAGKLPVNLLVGAYYNALRPPDTGAWTLRTQITFVF